ncbi:MAG TPA: NmrA family NAD(P)-binding protein [Candidatus Sulfomarinibacteraceae bacterium]|nr:NmrA family NAD(P)-binding protein [Candidatus Sulfomarinibacteraceae bacterium]
MILVVGATGTVGGRIAHGLLAQEKEVRILVRDPSPSVDLAPMGLATSADSLVAAGAQLVNGDLTDRASLTTACAEVDTVITTATAAKRDGDLEAVDLNGTLNLIDAAVEAGVSHFIYTSAYGSEIGSPNPMLHIRATCEKALVESGLTWTILQVSYLYEVLGSMVIGIPLQAGEPVSLFEDGRHRHSFISEADVAAFAIAAVDHPAAHNTRFELGGPSHSWREIVDATGKALGRELPVRFLPHDGELPLLDPGLNPWLVAMETFETFIDMGDIPAQFGVELTPLPTVMEQLFSS